MFNEVLPHKLIRIMKKNVYNLKLIALIMMMIGTNIFTSCNKDETISEPEIQTNYSDLAMLVKNGLEDIGNNLRKENTTFSSQSVVTLAAEQHFSDDPTAHNAFSMAYDEVTNSSNLKSAANDEVINSVVEEIEVGLINSNSSSEFVDFLQSKFDEISESEIQLEKKDLILQYITAYKTSIEYISDNVDVIAQDGQLKSVQAKWWDSWGRCAAGIVGGAGLGALTGGAAASVIPVLGTTAGLIIGGVAGGLSGAAAAC